MGFPRQEDWNALPFPSPGNLPNPGVEPSSPALQADSLLSSHQGSSGNYITSKNKCFRDLLIIDVELKPSLSQLLWRVCLEMR